LKSSNFIFLLIVISLSFNFLCNSLILIITILVILILLSKANCFNSFNVYLLYLLPPFSLDLFKVKVISLILYLLNKSIELLKRFLKTKSLSIL
jgi:hypothetical protein